MHFLLKLPHKTILTHSFLKLASTRFSSEQNPNRNSYRNKPSSAYYDDLIYEAGRSGDFNAVRILLNKRVKDGCFSTSNTFKFITNTDASISTLNDVFRMMATLERGLPRKDAYSSLIARLCKLNRIDESLRLASELVDCGIGVHQSVFYPILNAVTRARKMEDAWSVMELMRSAGMSPDVTAYNYFLTAYCCDGKLKETNDVLKKMDVEELSADSRTYDALVLGACRAGRVDGALVLMRKTIDEGLPVLYSSYGHVINALVKQGYYAQAVKFVIDNGGRDRKLDTESFGILASKLIDLKRIEDAKLVLEEMANRTLAMPNKLRNFLRYEH